MACSSTVTSFANYRDLHTWIIEDFSLYPEDDERCIDSDLFPAYGRGRRWLLKLYPYRSGDVHVSLTMFDLGSVIAKAKLWILDEKKSQRNALTLDFQTFESDDDRALGRIVSRAELFDASKGLLPNDTLTICCEVTTLDLIRYQNPKASRNPSIKDDICRLREDKDVSDVILVAGGKEFHAHKAVLAARSPVFRAMFRNDTKECSEGRVVIEDLSPEAVEEMLRYVYTNFVANPWALPDGVLQAAVKYQLPGLRTLGEVDALCKTSVENAAEMLRLADQLCLYDLRACIVSLIKNKTSEVLCTDGWKKALQEDPDGIGSVYCSRCRELIS